MTTHITRRSEELQREISATRADMDRTLTEIQGKFTPGQLLDQGLDYARNSGANEFVQNLGRSVKQNPVPMTLVGIGLVWLMASGRSNGKSLDYSARSSAGDRFGDVGDKFGEMRDGVGQAFGDVRDGVGDKLSEAKGRISSAAQGVKERAAHAQESLSETVQSARQRLSRTADGARHQVDRAREGYDWMVREHPLALGAIGVAVGALLAGAAPRTRMEDEFMGDKRDELMDRAKEAATEQVERVKEVAAEQVDQVRDSQSFDSSTPSDSPFEPTPSSSFQPQPSGQRPTDHRDAA